MPEHRFWSRSPGQPPLSRWIAQIESEPMPCACANRSSRRASCGYVTSVFFG